MRCFLLGGRAQRFILKPGWHSLTAFDLRDVARFVAYLGREDVLEIVKAPPMKASSDWNCTTDISRRQRFVRPGTIPERS